MNPLSLIAEVTHRCPLHCVYCSNPLEMQRREAELTTNDWIHVLRQAADLKILQVAFTGGEPLGRDDLEELVAEGRRLGLYINLITSGLGLTAKRLGALVEAGLDHVQLSFQDSLETPANEFAGAKAHARKLEAAAVIKTFPVAFTANLVIHRRNLERLEDMIAMAERIGADRLEIAHVQYYGWAFANRAALMPTAEQVKASTAVVKSAIERLRGKIRIEYVVPDYYAKYPKACMGGWGKAQLLVDPSGRALPCHSAMVIPGLAFDNVKDRALAEIWERSDAFNRFRGEGWMTEPCRSCERRTVDFGGCRCQAQLLAGDAAKTDPVCSLSSDNARLVAVREAERADFAERPAPWRYRKLSER